MRSSRNQAGFTLIELIITASFVAAASAAIVSIFITVGKINKQSRNMAIVTALAQEKIEVYRDGGYAALAIGSPTEDFSSKLPANLGSPKSAVTNVSLAQSGLKKVDIMITYTEEGRPKHIQLTTLMAEKGINR